MIAFCTQFVFAQESTKEYKVINIGFYNLENFFDTINDPTNDESFTPEGEYHYNTKIYHDKIGKLARVLSQIGTKDSPDGLACWGTAEIEHKHCLEELMRHPLLAGRNYKVIEYESPDERGIDCAFVYNPKYFTPISSQALPVILPAENDTVRNTTRDVLYVSGILDGELVHVFVNHWPSRRGGEEASAPLRDIAAGVSMKVVDSLMHLDPESKIIIMGDLNDDPVSHSLKEIIKAKGHKDEVVPGGMFNPFYEPYKKGYGTLAYRDAWGLFDQITISYGFMSKTQAGMFYQKSNIYNEEFMKQKTGQYKGYPMRTFSGTEYIGGYSDHFPTYVTFLKKK